MATAQINSQGGPVSPTMERIAYEEATQWERDHALEADTAARLAHIEQLAKSKRRHSFLISAGHGRYVELTGRERENARHRLYRTEHAITTLERQWQHERASMTVVVNTWEDPETTRQRAIDSPA